MLTLTFPGDGWAWRLPAWFKLLALAIWTLVLFQLGWPGLILALGASFAVVLGCGLALARVWVRILWVLWPFAALVVLWHLWLGTFGDGATILLRMGAAVGAANLVTMTTRLSDMQALVERVAAPLKHFGISPVALGLAFALVIRFIPVMVQRLAAQRDAWRARSPRRPGWQLAFPATLAALDDAERVAEALRARGGVV